MPIPSDAFERLPKKEKNKLRNTAERLSAGMRCKDEAAEKSEKADEREAARAAAQTGKRGGRFYITKTGRKVYVKAKTREDVGRAGEQRARAFDKMGERYSGGDK
jgi:hypothetical protein